MRKYFSLLIAFVCASFMMINAATYTVVGGSTAIFGTAWAPALEANDMVADGDVFKLVKEGIELPAGTIEYKIVVDHGWAKSYPQEGNASFSVAKSGKYDITFTLDLAANPQYSVEAVFKEDVVVANKAQLAGGFNSWSAADMTLSADKASASIEVALTEGTHEFKVVINDAWTSNGTSFTREAASATGITGNSNDNMKLVADVEGKYTFTWTFETSALAITFPEKGEDPIVEPEDSMTVYYVNKAGWAGAYAFVWPAEGNAYVAWPGEAMAKQAEKINEYDVYAYTFPAKYVNIIFNYEGAQTADLVWEAEKPYYYDGKWYAKADIPAGGETPEPVDSMTVYYVNSVNWEAVSAYVWVGEDVYKAWPGEAMEKTELKAMEKDVYSYKFPAKYTSIIFNNGGDKTSDLNWNAAKPYYCEGEWYASIDDIKPIVAAKFYLTGDSAFTIDAGLELAKTWSSSAIKVMEDFYEVSLKAGQLYKMVMTIDGSWETKTGYSELVEKPAGVTTDADNNINFTLAEAGKVKVIKTEAGFKVEGNFYVAPVEPVDSMTVYYVNKAGWASANAFVWTEGELGAYKAWPGEAMAKQAEKINEYDVYAYTFPAKYVNIIFNYEGAQTADLVWDAEKPYYYDGKWYAKADIPAGGEEPIVVPAKFYVTGNAALVGEEKQWKADAVKSESDTLVLDLAAGNFMMKLTLNGTWEGENNVKGYDALTEKAAGLVRGEGENEDNICFELKEAGLVQVIYTAEMFKLLGNFYVAPVEPVDSMTVYYLNKAAWENVNAFVWTEGELGAYKDWPGEAAKKEAEKINDIDVYAYTFPISYVNIIFNNGSAQTADLKWDADKPYFVPGEKNAEGKYEGTWYAKADIPADEPAEDPFVGFDAREKALGDQIAAGLAKNLVNVTFVETSEGKYSVNLVEGGVEGSFSFGGVVFAYKNSNAGSTAWKTYGTYIQANGKDREVRIPLKAGEKANVVLSEACDGVLVNGESMNLVAGDNIFTATADGLVLKSASTKPKIQAILPVQSPETPKYYAKNNWDGVTDWTWKEMTMKSDDDYQLECVFGGTGVNINTAESDEGAAWYASADIMAVDAYTGDFVTLNALDTIVLMYTPSEKMLAAYVLGKYVEPVTPPTPETKYYAKNNWEGAADWTWKEMTKNDEDDYQLECVFGGTGVNINTTESDEGADWYASADIMAVDAYTGDLVTLNALDTIVLMYTPSEKMLAAYVLGKYVEPVDPDPAKYYIAGTMTEWAKNMVEMTAGEDNSYSVDIALEADSLYMFKVVRVQGTDTAWYGAGMDATMHYGNSTDWSLYGDVDVKLQTTKAADYKFIFVANEAKNISVVIPEPDPYVPEHQNGFYLMGSHNEWAIDDAYLFVRNEQSEVEEYSLNVTLTVGEKIKPAYVENDEAKEWYGANDFEITEAYAGAKTVYFRPVRNGEWGAFGGFIYIEENTGTGISNTAVEGKAVKTISNGMLIIEKAGVRYNVMGQIIR